VAKIGQFRLTMAQNPTVVVREHSPQPETGEQLMCDLARRHKQGFATPKKEN
jgi:hypothetical protein